MDETNDPYEHSRPTTPTPVEEAMFAGMPISTETTERTGGANDRIVEMLDETARLFRNRGLCADQSPEGVRREIDRLVR
ncbi:hypothetical protein, partial [Streptomyces drozdowiczii]